MRNKRKFAKSKNKIIQIIENHVSKNEIVEKLWNIGDLSETEVDGINAVPRYYKISGFERPIAIISPNWTKGGAICGKERCIRLRAGANGNITYCNNIPEVSGDLLAKMTTEEMAECMADLIYKKNESTFFYLIKKWMICMICYLDKNCSV